MNSSGEPLDTESLKESLERISKKNEEGKKRAEEEKKRLEEKEEYLTLLGKANSEIQGIKNSMVTRKEMAKFFEDFLNVFNRAVDGIGDKKTNGAFSKFKENTRELVNAFKEW